MQSLISKKIKKPWGGGEHGEIYRIVVVKCRPTLKLDVVLFSPAALKLLETWRKLTVVCEKPGRLDSFSVWFSMCSKIDKIGILAETDANTNPIISNKYSWTLWNHHNRLSWLHLNIRLRYHLTLLGKLYSAYGVFPRVRAHLECKQQDSTLGINARRARTEWVENEVAILYKVPTKCPKNQ